jgi:hypothetical protein
MLSKRKRFKKMQILLKLFFLKNELKLLIIKSLLKNHYNHFLLRLSFTISILFKKQEKYLKSLQKLICPYSLCKRVPDKNYLFSRFFLNLQFNSLNINNTYK